MREYGVCSPNNRAKGIGAEMMRKNLLALLLVFSLLITMMTVPAFAQNDGAPSSSGNKSFTDVPPGHWAYNAITWMAAHEILAGKGNNRFDPEAAVTREQFARIMVVALQLKMGSSYAPSFNDVSKDSWAFRYVEAAKLYLTGWRNAAGGLDYFKPYDNAVREDMAVALVKALKLENEVPDNSVLDLFTDKADISPNLVKYVAIAVKNEIINGNKKNDGTRTFDAQGTLTRAQASVLVFNALVKAGDKVTYDDLGKVTYEAPDVPQPEVLQPLAGKGPTVTAAVSGDKLRVSWTRIGTDGFQGYKVVLSKGDSTPVYPENGYQAWITDRDQTSIELKAGSGYNGGDVGGNLKAGIPYFLSITAGYDDAKVPGNVLKVTLPGSSAPSEGALPVPVVRKSEEGGLSLNWNKINDERFQGYKVVLSRNDSTPQYSENGYLAFITDRSTISWKLIKGDKYNNGDFGETIQPGTYYATITALYAGDQKRTGNVVTLSIP